MKLVDLDHTQLFTVISVEWLRIYGVGRSEYRHRVTTTSISKKGIRNNA